MKRANLEFFEPERITGNTYFVAMGGVLPVCLLVCSYCFDRGKGRKERERDSQYNTNHETRSIHNTSLKPCATTYNSIAVSLTQSPGQIMKPDQNLRQKRKVL